MVQYFASDKFTYMVKTSSKIIFHRLVRQLFQNIREYQVFWTLSLLNPSCILAKQVDTISKISMTLVFEFRFWRIHFRKLICVLPRSRFCRKFISTFALSVVKVAKVCCESAQKPFGWPRTALAWPKCQLISKCPFGAKTSSKKPTKFFPEFLP